MPNPRPKTEQLTKGNAKALKALGVEPLPPGQVSVLVRMRVSRETQKVIEREDIGPKELGEIFERGLTNT